MFLGEEDNLVLQEIGEHQNKSNQTLSFGGGGNLLMEAEYFPDCFHLHYTLAAPCNCNRLAERRKTIFQKYFAALMQ